MIKKLFIIILLSASIAHAEDILTDGFESGNLFSPGGTTGYWGASNHHDPAWTDGTATETVAVSSDMAYSGTYSLKFVFPSGMANVWAEQRLELGAQHDEVWVRYYIHIPSNYNHGTYGGTTNNKFLAIYAIPYTTPGFQINLSTDRVSSSQSTLDLHMYDDGAEVSPSLRPTSNFISSAFFNTWMEIIAHVKVPTTTSSNDGVIQVWRNGTQIANYTNLDIYGSASRNYINEFYLLGWSNSGFTSAITYYIDDILVSDTEITPGSGDSTPPTVSSATVNGAYATVNCSESVSITNLDDGDFTMTGSTSGALSLGSCSLSDADTIICTASSSFVNGETVTLAYSGGTDEVEDAAGNDMATFSGTAVTNNTAAPATGFKIGNFAIASAKQYSSGPFDPNSAKQIGPFTISLSGTPELVCTDYVDYSNSANRDLWASGPGQYNGHYYKGFIFYTGETVTVCEVTIYFGDTGGNPSLNDFYLELHSLSSNNFVAVASPTGRSEKVDGATWYGAAVTFTFDPPVEIDMSTGTRFGFAWKEVDNDDPATTIGEIDLTNYTQIGMDNEANTMTGNEGWGRWDASGVFTMIDAEDDPIVMIRTMQ